jgi:hypothetical protein
MKYHASFSMEPEDRLPVQQCGDYFFPHPAVTWSSGRIDHAAYGGVRSCAFMMVIEISKTVSCKYFFKPLQHMNMINRFSLSLMFLPCFCYNGTASLTEISDLSGKVLISEARVGTEGINTSQLAAGLYLLKASSGDRVTVHKIRVAH